MGEILQINFGYCGNDIGQLYLEKLIQDHYLDKSNNLCEPDIIDHYKINNSFEEYSEKQYIFRGIFVDVDQKNIDSILTSSSGQYLHPDFTISNHNQNISGTHHGSCNLFKNEMQPQLEQMIRKVVEKCDNFFGFNMVHSTYDKCCGISASALNPLCEQYRNRFLSSYSMFPNTDCSSPIEIYNFAFGIVQLVDLAQITFPYDYQALEQATKLSQLQPNFKHSHDIVAETILQANCSQRLPGFQNSDLKKLSTNMIPFPRKHFLTCSFSPFDSNRDFLNQLYRLSDPFHTYYTYDWNATNIYISQALIIRSKNYFVETTQVNNKFNNLAYWLEDGCFHVNCKIEHRHLGETAMHIGNQNYFGQSLRRFCEAFTASLRRKAFLHYFYQEGADEMEFTEAESNINDLCSEYYDCCQGCFSDYDEE